MRERTQEDVINIALDAMGEAPMDSVERPRGDIQRRAVRRYNDALVHVMQQARFSDARTQETLPDSSAASDTDLDGFGPIEPDPIIFTEYGFRQLSHLHSNTETTYFRRSILPENFGGKVWHVNGLEQGWVVTTVQGTGQKQIEHNFQALPTVVYNRLLSPAEMGQALARCVGLKLAMDICVPKDGDQNMWDRLGRHYRDALQNAALVDDGGEIEPLHSDWLLYAQTGGDYYGGGGY